jgi:N-acetylglucosaminyldiphosphoundecaprenol N-acetyl-beta-D-mannosaminyltransferase
MDTRRCSPDAAPPERVRLLGVTVDRLTLPALTALVGTAVARKERWVIAHHNLHSVALHRRDPEVRALYARARFVHADGMSLVAVARWLGLPLGREHRVTYADWTGPLMAEAAARGWRVFHLGGRPGVAARGAAVLRRRHPGLRIATAHGWFDAAPGSRDSERRLARIAAFRPDVLMVGMGMPRQERWILHHLERLPAAAVLPCGACMDYVAGAVPTPPRWAGRLGAEWLFRLAVEPRRLWRRYLLEPWGLLPLLAAELREARGRRRSAAAGAGGAG